MQIKTILRYYLIPKIAIIKLKKHTRDNSLIPDHGTYPGFRFGPCSGWCGRQLITVPLSPPLPSNSPSSPFPSLPHSSSSLPSSLLPFPSLSLSEITEKRPQVGIKKKQEMGVGENILMVIIILFIIAKV